ncbi:MAG TPA: PIN domain-containing protein [Candidatus Diapherotrites archaeon]|uniref:PIN domain-containing protein n=1 Tax=Candidatus Iainarchaeum sp. TaxID=3101447 RepID=A0A7J4JJM7_9ARCH|nr:type II toxin-antitoxin system VapC family toxin [Candidatus Diapherotrites archaeon]HIH16147.1 PIN domain-containing protein [Candidatus Diapherotrites archaeon]
MQRVYLDSNVFIAVIRGDMGKPFRLMYQFSMDFLVHCQGRFEVILSDVTLKEIRCHAYSSPEEALALFAEHGIRVTLVGPDESNKRRAKEIELLGVHYPDSLHVALALRWQACAIVTWNVKDFEPVRHLIDVREPAGFG